MNVKNRLVQIFKFTLALFTVWLAFLYAETDLEDASDIIDSTLVMQSESTYFDSLYYEADFLDYFVDKETILLKGEAKITYESSIIKADSIMINFEKNQAAAFGRIVMEDNSQLILGESGYYDIETQYGIVKKGASRFDLGYYYGEEIRKVWDDVFDVDHGKFTTCDGKHPHFYVRSDDMRVYRDHMVVGKPLTFYVNELPIFRLPFGAFSIKRGRVSGFLAPSPGYSQGEGKSINNVGYFYVINDYADVTFSMDLIEKHGYNYKVNLLYLDRYNYRGSFDGKYKYKILSPESHRNDWELRYRHFHYLPEKATFDASLDFASSRNVWENEVDPNQRLTETIRSSISYRKPFTTSSFVANASYDENLLTKEKSILLPSYSYSLPSKPIHEFITAIPDSVRRQSHWWKPFSFRWSTAGAHTGRITGSSPSFAQVFYKNEKDEMGNYLSQHHAGIGQTIALSWNHNTFGWLRLGSSLNYRDGLFDRDREGNTLVHGYSYNTSSSASFSLYGIRNFQKFPVSAVRHIVTPSASFNYSPDFYEKNRVFYSVPGVSVASSRKTRMVGLNLEQKWQFKLRAGEDGQERRLNDLFVLRTSTGYNLEKETKKWSDINQTLTINPGSYEVKKINFGINQNYSATQQTYNNFNVSSWRMSTSANISGNAQYYNYFPIEPNDFITGNYFAPDSTEIINDQIRTIEDLERLKDPGSWSLGTSHDYSYQRSSKRETQNLRNNLSLKLTTNWSVSYSNYYNLETKQLTQQNLSVVRELHCWRINFSYAKSAHVWQYNIVLFNIKIPDAKIDTKDTSR